MLKEFKGDLVDVVSASTEVLNDEDALAIIEICKSAADKAIAEATERYLIESLNTGADGTGDSE